MQSLETRTLLASFAAQGFAESLVDDGLLSPTAMAFAPDGRLFVAEKGGAIRVIKNGALLDTPFATVTTDTFGERGLGGITFDPDFETNHFVYVYYTAASPDIHNRVSRIVADGDVAVPGSEQVLLDLPAMTPSAAVHNGGALQFAPDGTLYVAVGEQGSGVNVGAMTHPFGKILRINDDGTIPTDNPFYNTTTGINRAIWATGLRNPFTTAFQPGTGKFFINDVGEESWEEINEGVAGANYGWTTTEGPFDPLTHPGLTNPFYAYPHPEGFAVTGGVFYNPTNPQFPSQYVGEYFFADYAIGFIKHLDPESGVASEFMTGAQYPVDLDVGPEGALYYLSRATNSVYKITATQAPQMVMQPASQLIHRGDPVTFSVSASGQTPLSYQWQRDGIDIPGATSSSYTIAITRQIDDGAVFRCIVSNALGSITSSDATLTITSDTPPAPAIAVQSTFYAGETINFSGGAFDLEDGTIPASNMTWEVVFHHNTHTHPHVEPFSGTSGGSFLVPTVGHTAPDVWYRVHLTVTDSAGFVRSTYRDVTPQLMTVTINTNVPGLSVSLDGQPQATPKTVTSVRGVQRVLTAMPTQVHQGITYTFEGWSDGGDATHAIVWPDDPTTYIATYTASTVNPLSNMDWSEISTSLPRRDLNVGGGPLIVENVVYAKGIGMLSGQWAKYDLDGDYHRFTSSIGADDIVGDQGTMVFEVWGDGVKLYDSGVMTGASSTQNIDIDISGVNELMLKLSDGEDGFNGDWGDWINPTLYANTALAPLSPGNLNLTSPFYNRVHLSWADRSSNEQGFVVERSVDNEEFEAIATLAAGVTSYIDVGRQPDTQYYYRVSAFNPVGPSATTPAIDITTGPTTLGPGWLEADVGNVYPVAAGSAAFDAGTFTVTGGGFGTANEADSFHFVYRVLDGDGEIVARVMSVQDVASSRGGVMIRQSLDANSRSAFLSMGNNGVPGFVTRSAPGADSNWTFGAAVAFPHYLKLTRTGDSVEASISPDGQDWTHLEYVTLDAPGPVYIGLATTSWYPTFLASAVFDNVSFTNVAPTVAQSASAVMNASQTSASLSARGNDSGGEAALSYTWSVVSKPDGAADPEFNVNGKQAARDAIATFSALGAYTLRVTISDGYLTVSSDVDVVVEPALSSIVVTPTPIVMGPSMTQQFSAIAKDQFGAALVAQPELDWSASAGIVDAAGNYTSPNTVGSYTVTATAGAVSGNATVLVDTAGAVATPSWTANPVAGAATWTFSVTYTHPVGIDVTSLGDDDLIVMAPDGTIHSVELLSVDNETAGTPRTATYQLTVNDGSFDSLDNGVWTISLVADSVFDALTEPFPAGPIGAFDVDVPYAALDQNGVLIVNGTMLDDELSLSTNGLGELLVELNGDQTVFQASAPIQSIVFRGFDGDDSLNYLTTIAHPVNFDSGGQGDMLNVNGGTLNLDYDLSGITLNIAPGALVILNAAQHLLALNMSGGTLVAAGGSMIVTQTLSMTPSSRLDVNAGALIVHSGELGTWDGGYTALTGELSLIRNGIWDGAGIGSTAAADQPATGLAIARAGDLLDIAPSETITWRGQTVTGDSVLIMYTWVADADLDGDLDGDDYFIIDSNVAQSGVVFGFTAGDFDYDGDIDGDDYFLIDSYLLYAQTNSL